MTLFVPCIIFQCVYDQRDEQFSQNNSYNQFLFHSFFLYYMFRTNLVVHHQKHSIIYCITHTVQSVQSCLFRRKSSRSSSGARHNILYYTVKSVQSCLFRRKSSRSSSRARHNILYYTHSTIGTIVLVSKEI